jgi:hypothetical protein
MKKRAQWIILAVYWLYCLSGARFTEGILLEPGKVVFPAVVLEKLDQQLPEKKSLATDLAALMSAPRGSAWEWNCAKEGSFTWS